MCTEVQYKLFEKIREANNLVQLSVDAEYKAGVDLEQLRKDLEADPDMDDPRVVKLTPPVVRLTPPAVRLTPPATLSETLEAGQHGSQSSRTERFRISSEPSSQPDTAHDASSFCNISSVGSQVSRMTDNAWFCLTPAQQETARVDYPTGMFRPS